MGVSPVPFVCDKNVHSSTMLPFLVNFEKSSIESASQLIFCVSIEGYVIQKVWGYNTFGLWADAFSLRVKPIPFEFFFFSNQRIHVFHVLPWNSHAPSLSVIFDFLLPYSNVLNYHLCDSIENHPVKSTQWSSLSTVLTRNPDLELVPQILLHSVICSKWSLAEICGFRILRKYQVC